MNIFPYHEIFVREDFYYSLLHGPPSGRNTVYLIIFPVLHIEVVCWILSAWEMRRMCWHLNSCLPFRWLPWVSFLEVGAGDQRKDAHLSLWNHMATMYFERFFSVYVLTSCRGERAYECNGPSLTISSSIWLTDFILSMRGYYVWTKCDHVLDTGKGSGSMKWRS